MKETNKKLVGIATAGSMVAFAVGAGVGSYAFPQTIVEDAEPIVINLTAEEYALAFENGAKSVEPIVINNTEIIKVDNENLALVLKTAYDADGDLSVYTEDLFEEELDEVVVRIAQVNEWKAEAENIIKSQFARELDRQHDFDRRDVSRVTVEDTSISGIDFKYKESTVNLEVEFRYESQLYVADVEVEFYDGKALPITISNPILK
jgi:hypothetical protein